MTELTVPSLPAKSDARQLSTLSTPLLFSHRLCGQEKCQETPIGQQQLTEQRLMELTFVTLTLCRCGEAEVEKDSGCNDRLSFYLACFESAPQPDWQFSLTLSDEAAAQTELIKIGCSAQHATTSDPHITISRSGGENLEGVFWGVLVEFPISLLNGCQSPILHLTYRRDEVVSSPFADSSARLHCI